MHGCKLLLVTGLLTMLPLLGCGNDDGVCSGASCNCEGSDNCEFSCPQGGCSQNCDNQSTCRASCEGGGCSQTCAGAANCTFTCDGGRCSQSCTGSTGVCSATCAPANCTSDLP